MSLTELISKVQDISPYGSLISVIESEEVAGEIKSIKLKIVIN